jgi:hypothetical protein
MYKTKKSIWVEDYPFLASKGRKARLCTSTMMPTGSKRRQSFFRWSEEFKTVFSVEVHQGGYYVPWTFQRTYTDFVHICKRFAKDYYHDGTPLERERFRKIFLIEGEDGSDDTMAIIARREAVEGFMHTMLAAVDILSYPPFFEFTCMAPSVVKVAFVLIPVRMRMYTCKPPPLHARSLRVFLTLTPPLHGSSLPTTPRLGTTLGIPPLCTTPLYHQLDAKARVLQRAFKRRFRRGRTRGLMYNHYAPEMRYFWGVLSTRGIEVFAIRTASTDSDDTALSSSSSSSSDSYDGSDEGSSSNRPSIQDQLVKKLLWIEHCSAEGGRLGAARLCLGPCPKDYNKRKTGLVGCMGEALTGTDLEASMEAMMSMELRLLDGDWELEAADSLIDATGVVPDVAIPLADVADIRSGMDSAGWRALLEQQSVYSLYVTAVRCRERAAAAAEAVETSNAEAVAAYRVAIEAWEKKKNAVDSANRTALDEHALATEKAAAAAAAAAGSPAAGSPAAVEQEGGQTALTTSDLVPEAKTQIAPPPPTSPVLVSVPPVPPVTIMPPMPMEEDLAFTVVSSTGAMDLTLPIQHLPALPHTVFTSAGGRSPSNSAPCSGPRLVRDWLCDSLDMWCTATLTSGELASRHKGLRRRVGGSSSSSSSSSGTTTLSQREMAEAKRVSKLISSGLPIEEERYPELMTSPHGVAGPAFHHEDLTAGWGEDGTLQAWDQFSLGRDEASKPTAHMNILWLHEPTMRLYIGPQHDRGGMDLSSPTNISCLDVADISDIRSGEYVASVEPLLTYDAYWALPLLQPRPRLLSAMSTGSGASAGGTPNSRSSRDRTRTHSSGRALSPLSLPPGSPGRAPGTPTPTSNSRPTSPFSFGSTSGGGGGGGHGHAPRPWTADPTWTPSIQGIPSAIPRGASPWRVVIVSSETTISLPMPSAKTRNKLLRRLQLFVSAYQGGLAVSAHQDTSSSSSPEMCIGAHKLALRATDFTPFSAVQPVFGAY